jgi:hypothetical protein
VRPRPKRGPVTVPDVPDRPAGRQRSPTPAGRSMYAIHCGVLNHQCRSGPQPGAQQG